MSLAFDPEYLPALEPLMPLLLSRPVAKVHDYKQIRENVTTLFGQASKRFGYPEGVVQDRYKITSYDGTELDMIHSYKSSQPSTGPPTAAIVHAHGGGMIAGSIDEFSTGIAFNADQSGVPIFSINYRKAPESPAPTPTEDVYAGLQYVQANAAKFNIDPARIAIMGESAGGGIAAGVALMARDRKLSPPLAKQILIYPMLDDTNLTPDPSLAPFVTWNYDSNITGWTCLLGADKAGNPEADVPIYSAPARASDLSGLPRTYMDVGELDIFKVEDVEYVSKLAKVQVPVEFHLYPGVPHAFEALAPGIWVSTKARENRIRAMQDF